LERSACHRLDLNRQLFLPAHVQTVELADGGRWRGAAGGCSARRRSVSGGSGGGVQSGEGPPHEAGLLAITPRRASSIRDCDPGPVSQECATTAWVRRSVPFCFVGAFWGPRCPGRRRVVAAKNVSTAFGSQGPSPGWYGSANLRRDRALDAHGEQPAQRDLPRHRGGLPTRRRVPSCPTSWSIC
jgi:hypothetical protein